MLKTKSKQMNLITLIKCLLKEKIMGGQILRYANTDKKIMCSL